MSKMTFYSWQQTAVTVPANDWIEVTFDQQVKPNIFLIKNYGTEQLEVGFTFVPNRDKKDKTIYATSDDLMGSPVPRERIFIYNAGDSDCSITIYSDFLEKFDWSVLKNTTNAYIQGIAPDVRIDSDYTEVITALSSNHNNLAELLIEHHGELLNELATGNKEAKLIPKAGFISSESAGNGSFSNVHSINLIANDGYNDLVVRFGMNSEFTLKPGEILTDIKGLENNTFEYQANESFNIRFLYYEKEEV